MDDTIFTHPPILLIGPCQRRDKTFMILFTHFATLIGPMLDPPTHNRPFADKRDKVGMDGVPKFYVDMGSLGDNEKITVDNFEAVQSRDAIHTHFVTLIDKWTIAGGWVKH